MPKLQLSALSRRVACSDPCDGPEQRLILERLTDVLRSIDRTRNRDACEYLDGAILLTMYLTRLSEVGGGEVCGVVASLVNQAALSLNNSDSIEVSSVAAQEPRPLEGMLLGEIMLRRGMILEEDIERALALKESLNLPFGQLLVRIGAATARQVEDALAYQRDCRGVVEGYAERRIPSKDGGTTLAGGRAQESSLTLCTEPDSGPRKSLELRLVTEGLLGEILVGEGLVTPEQVQKALVAQRVTGMRMGEALVDLGACTWDDVQRAMDIQRERARR